MNYYERLISAVAETGDAPAERVFSWACAIGAANVLNVKPLCWKECFMRTTQSSISFVQQSSPVISYV